MEILQTTTIGIMFILFAGFEFKQHKKTRKDQQEIKTRLTQVRKDLNTIEKLLRKAVKHGK